MSCVFLLLLLLLLLLLSITPQGVWVCVCVCVCVCPSRVFSPLLPPPPASGPYWNLHRYQLTLWQIAAVAVAEADAA